MKSMSKLGAVGTVIAPLVLIGGGLVAPPAAVADSGVDCDFQPLRYDLAFGGGWRAKANLRVHDLCEAGAFRGRIFKKGRGFGTPRLYYKRQLDQTYRSAGVTLIPEPRLANGWKPYRVTSEDIDLVPDGGYFMEVKIRWRSQRARDVGCDRIHDRGGNAFLCRRIVP